MLIRPGSKSGPNWMRSISESLSDPERARKVMMPFWAFFALYMFICIGVTHFITAVVFSKDYLYESHLHIAGLPLLSYGAVAHGIIAIGGRATGIVAMGGTLWECWRSEELPWAGSPLAAFPLEYSRWVDWR